MITLIDGDVLVYRCGFASQKKEFGDPAPISHCLSMVKLSVNAIINETSGTDYKVFLSGPTKDNFRTKIAVTPGPRGLGYKAGRPDKPIHYQAIRDYLTGRWAAETTTTIEADDALGILQTKYLETGVDSIVASIDKDLRGFLGSHYDFVKKIHYTSTDPGELYFHEGKRSKLYGGGVKWFYAQLLMGDAVDNIPGIKGYGPVKAFNTLDEKKDEKEYLETVANIYSDFYGKEYKEKLYEMSDLLWILRHENEFKSNDLKKRLK